MTGQLKQETDLNGGALDWSWLFANFLLRLAQL
jgi:hypothetical protein